MNQTDLITLASAIRAGLDFGPWRSDYNPDTPHPAVDLANDHGERFRIEYDAHDRRLHVKPLYGELWKHRPHGIPSPAITVNPARSPATVARDISRRFLPALLNDYDDARKRYDKHLQTIAQAHANAEMLIETAAGRLRRPAYNATGDQTCVYLFDTWVGYAHPSIKAEVTDGTVHLDLRNLPPDLAAAVILTLVDLVAVETTGEDTH